MSEPAEDHRSVEEDPIAREELAPEVQPEERLTVADLGKVKLNMTADLGARSMLVRDILELGKGSVLPLNKLAGEMADISVNGIPMAKGELVVLGDNLHVRVAEIYGLEEHETVE